MASGKSVHDAIEADMISRLERDKPLEEGQLVEIATDSLNQTASDSEISDIDQDPDLKETTTKVQGLIGAYTTYVAPTIGRVLSVEEKLKAKMVFGDHEWNLHGYVDCIDVDPETGVIRLRDWKTSKAKMDETTQRRSLQWPMYSFLAQANGYDTARVRVDAMRVLKSGPAHQVLEFDRGPEHIRRLANVVLKVDEMYQRNLFTPDPFSSGCKPSFCEFWDDCPYRAPDDPEDKVQG